MVGAGQARNPQSSFHSLRGTPRAPPAFTRPLCCRRQKASSRFVGTGVLDRPLLPQSLYYKHSNVSPHFFVGRGLAPAEKTDYLANEIRTIILASKKLCFWHFVPCCASFHSRNARGAIFAASLTSELADSALLDYLRRRPLRELRRSRRESLFLRQKTKSRPNGRRFLAEKERFELSRRFPDLLP